jgi:hypothetical protein
MCASRGQGAAITYEGRRADSPATEVTGICFGGANFDALYVTCGDKAYKRTLKVPGAPGWVAPIKLSPWGGG